MRKLEAGHVPLFPLDYPQAKSVSLISTDEYGVRTYQRRMAMLEEIWLIRPDGSVALYLHFNGPNDVKIVAGFRQKAKRAKAS